MEIQSEGDLLILKIISYTKKKTHSYHVTNRHYRLLGHVQLFQIFVQYRLTFLSHLIRS